MCCETYLNIASILPLKKQQEVQAGEEKLKKKKKIPSGWIPLSWCVWHPVRAKNIKDDLGTSGG